MNGYQKLYKWIFLGILIFLESCTVRPPINGSYAQMQKDLMHGVVQNKQLNKPCYIPISVKNALLPTVTPRFLSARRNTRNSAVGQFDVSADNVPAKSFFMGLVDGTPYNMVIDPKVTGSITLHLKNVTIMEVLDAIRDVYGYEYRRTSYGFEISPPEIQTQIFNVNYLDVKRTGKSLTQMSSGEISQQLAGANANANPAIAQQGMGGSTTQAAYVPISTVDTTSEMNFWKSLEKTLQNMIGTADNRTVTVNGQSGVVIVHAYPRELHMIANYLCRIQSNMTRQVILEAKILEIQLNDQFQSGVNWNLFGKGYINTPTEFSDAGGVNQHSTSTFERTDLKDFTDIFALNVKGDFGVLIKLLQTQGNVQVLSSPRISTLNNQKAVIKVGEDEFFVTGVSSTTTVAGSATIPTQNVTLTPFFSGITLDVTPQISKKGIVILHVHPTISTVKTQQKDITVGTVIGTTTNGTSTSAPNTLSLPLALSDVRESDNIVRARNKQIIVIGGLMRNDMIEEIAGTPVLSKIPFIGAAFRRTAQRNRKTELVILLRPIVIDRRAWISDLEKTSHDFARLRRGFHIGGLPEVFGTQGEVEYPSIGKSIQYQK